MQRVPGGWVVRLASLAALCAAPAAWSVPLSDLSPDRAHLGNFPGELVAGRITGIAIDPSNPSRVLAAANNGGIFGSDDSGAHWETWIRPDGTPGTYGIGLQTSGETHFSRIAMDGQGNALVMGWHKVYGDSGPGSIYFSSDSGHHWKRAVTPAPFSGNFNARSGIAFGPSGTGYAVGGGQFGVSTDHGASWSWSSALGGSTANSPFLTGLDVIQVKGTQGPFGSFPGADGAEMIGFCAFDVSAPTGAPPPPLKKGEADVALVVPSLNIWGRIGIPAGSATSFIPMTVSTCQVAFDPNNPLRIYVALQGTTQVTNATGSTSGVYQVSIHPGQGATWFALGAPAGGNGRSVYVQAAAVDQTSTSVFFGNSFDTYQHYYLSKADPPPAGWTRLPALHSDPTRLAFAPGSACPVFGANDGGIESISNCTNSTSSNPAGWSFDRKHSGLHAMQAWGGAFAQDGNFKTLAMGLQDNGLFHASYTYTPIDPSNGSLTWTDEDVCGDTWWAIADYTDPSRLVGTCAVANPMPQKGFGPNVRKYENLGGLNESPGVVDMTGPLSGGSPLYAKFARMATWAWGAASDFIAPGRLAVPTYTTTSGSLQMFVADLTSLTFTATGQPSFLTLSDVPPALTQLQGDIAATGRESLNGGPGSFYVYFIPSLGTAAKGAPPVNLTAPLWVFDGANWTPLTSIPAPVRVFGDQRTPGRAYVVDKNGVVWKTTSPLVFEQAQDLTKLARSKAGGSNELPCYYSVCSVAFDPANPARIAVGTADNGIFVSNDDGVSWSEALGAPPKPHNGITGLFFDPSSPFPNNENGIALTWGRGAWAFQLNAIKMVVGPPANGQNGILAGNIAGVEGITLAGQALEAVVTDLRRARRLQRRDGRAVDAAEPAPLIDESSEPAPLPFFDPLTVPLLTGRLGRVIAPPPPREPPTAEVARFPVELTADLQFSFALPPLPPGQYLVQVILPGSAQVPRTTAGTEICVPRDDDGDRSGCTTDGGDGEDDDDHESGDGPDSD